MKVSVVIPTYNRVETIGRALKSVSQQTIQPFEVIVVDDGSDDDTGDLIKLHYPNVRYLSQNNQGVSSARNFGIHESSGDWLAFLDSDDEWLPTKLESQLASLSKTNLLVSHTEEIWIRNGVRVNQMNKHQKHGGDIFEHCLPMCAMSPSSIIIHRSVFDRIGLFDESFPACEDYDLWLRIAAEFEVDFIVEPCIRKYGGHADQLSRLHWGMDRFRVVALENILNINVQKQVLDDTKYTAAIKMLNTKLTILLKGATKHNNSELIDYCHAAQLRWSHD